MGSIFDGHGGKPKDGKDGAGRDISQYCIKEHPDILLKYLGEYHDADPEEALKKSYIDIDAGLHKLPIDAQNAGSTATTCLVQGDMMYVANVGDSRCIMACETEEGGYEIVTVTSDHRPDFAEERKRIEKAGGRVCVSKIFSCCVSILYLVSFHSPGRSS